MGVWKTGSRTAQDPSPWVLQSFSAWLLVAAGGFLNPFILSSNVWMQTGKRKEVDDASSEQSSGPTCMCAPALLPPATLIQLFQVWKLAQEHPAEVTGLRLVSSWWGGRIHVPLRRGARLSCRACDTCLIYQGSFPGVWPPCGRNDHLLAIPLVVSQTKHGSHVEGTSPGPALRAELRAGFAARICVSTVNVYTVTFVRLLHLVEKAKQICGRCTLKAQ